MSKRFDRDAKDLGLGDEALIAAVATIERGLISADLGGGLLKQRIPRPGEGKSGGFRTVLVFSKADRAVFIYIFAKNSKGALDTRELRALKAQATTILGFTPNAMADAVRAGGLREIERR